MSDSSGGRGGLVGLGDLSKPATVLIERISDAVGGIAKPWQTLRVAKAEAKANLIRAQNRIEISALEERALLRMVREEGKKQGNIESITAQAILSLEQGANPENMDSDWITHFFDKCRLVSDADMQSLWAKILSGEASNPGTFSKRTVDLMGSLDKSDAELFTNFCQFVWMTGNLVPMIDDLSSDVFSSNGINFMSMTHLNDIGLIAFNNITGFQQENMPKKFVLSYYGMPVVLENTKGEQSTMRLGKAILTRAGVQLAKICGSKKSMKYFNYILDRWFSSGEFVMTLPIDAKQWFMEGHG